MKLQSFLVVGSLLAVALAFSEEHITPYSNFANIPTKNGGLFPPVSDGNTTEQRETRPLSHVVGVWQKPSSPLLFGPDFGAATSPPNTWTLQIPSAPVADTKFLLLHFAGVNLPASNKIEVDLGYDTDVFTSADGGAFWTRPINTKALAGAPVVVRYITNGASTGQAQIDHLGIGERHAGYQPPWPYTPNGFSNCDPFFTDAAYTEPKYDQYWYCNDPPNWENTACVTDPNDVRARVARSVGMILTPESKSPYGNPSDPNFGVQTISTCSVTLIDTDVVIFAGHCFDFDEDALSSSVTFDYETKCNDNRVPGYNPKFYKVKQVIAHRFNNQQGPEDWAILRLAQAPTGVPPIQLRPDLPSPGEQVFGIHHPNGAVKKLSVPHPDFDTITTSSVNGINVPSNFHVSGGSSGSGLFDTAGRYLGTLSNGGNCGDPPLSYYPAFSILANLAPVPPNPVTRDVMIVFDRSGSMSQLDLTQRTKIEVARDAVSLFVQLIRPGVGNRVGLVSFSTTASVDFVLTSVDSTAKQNLIGAAPYSGGKVGALTPNGATSIGDGLQKALAQLPAGAPGSNPRAILLLTDGMENTDPKIANGQPPDSAFKDIAVHAVGFGTPANLDSNLLTQFTSKHQGMYTGAETGVSLMKFFSHAFGNIFETGILQDPEFDLPSNQDASPPLTFNVCHEEVITVAVGWDNIQGVLAANLTTPNGIVIGSRSANVESAQGRSWTFLRVPLPYGGEQTGTWNLTVYRPPPAPIPIIPRFLAAIIRQLSPPPALHYFVNVIPTGGPILSKAFDNRTYYTGDIINPRVFFHFGDGSWPDPADIELTLSRPNASIGNILSKTGLHPPVTQYGDILPSRQTTLGDIGVVITQIEEPFELSNDPENSGGFFEDTGLFGKILNDTLIVEGDYLFHFRASTKDSCLSTREVLWSIHIDVGIDASKTAISVTIIGSDAKGHSTGVIVVTPQDPYGNLLGPGRGDSITFTGTTGTTITGPIVDNGNGSYTIPISYKPFAGSTPGVIIQQPGRPPVTIQQPGHCPTDDRHPGGDKCDDTTSRSSTPFGTMCACHPGHKANAKDSDASVHWRLKWPVAGHGHRVYVKPGVACDTLCDEWWLGPESCEELGVSVC